MGHRERDGRRARRVLYKEINLASRTVSGEETEGEKVINGKVTQSGCKLIYPLLDIGGGLMGGPRVTAFVVATVSTRKFRRLDKSSLRAIHLPPDE